MCNRKSKQNDLEVKNISSFDLKRTFYNSGDVLQIGRIPNY